MQPYFFPYPGHFSLIAACDEWVVFDTCQYTPRRWMNRNRILHPAGGWKWLSLPLDAASIHIRTDQVRLLHPSADGVLGQLRHYRRAPHYAAVAGLVQDAFAGAGGSLVRLNVRALAAVCRYIGLPFRHRVCSQLDLPSGLGPGEWAPAICAALGATGYVNPVGGRALFDPAEFERRGLDLRFLDAQPFEYGAVPGLSILDALMWNPPEAVLAAVRRYALLPATAAG